MTQTNTLISPVLEALKQSVISVSSQDSLDGLVALHFDTHARLRNAVNWRELHKPSEWATAHADRLFQAPLLAFLGCLISEHGDENTIEQTCKESFIRGIEALRARKEDFLSSTSWILQPTVVLGIALGIHAVHHQDSREWFVDVVKRGAARQTLPLLPRLTFLYILSLFDATPAKVSPATLVENVDDCSLPELSLALWLASREIGDWRAESRIVWLSQGQQKLIERLIVEPVYEGEDYKAALLWVAATDCINQGLLVPDASQAILRMLENLPYALERWKPSWRIEEEGDLQRIVFLVLRTYFDDLRYEETLPKLGRSGHRYDIGVPHLRLLVELKYARAKADFQKFVHEIGQDSAQIHTQTTFTSFVVFIYDTTCSTEQYGWTRNAIREFAPVKDCIIVCAPSVARYDTI